MRKKILRLAVLFEGGLIILALGLGLALGVFPPERLDLRWRTAGWGVAATLPPLLAMWWCTHSQWPAFLRLMREVEEKIVPSFADCSPFELALISLLAGVGEEAFFRGVLQSALSDWLSPWGALAVVSVLFGLGHLITPAYAVLAGLLGFYLGALMVAYDNLILVMVVHALYDFVTLAYLVNRISSGNSIKRPSGS